jgi:hypothetical protein
MQSTQLNILIHTHGSRFIPEGDTNKKYKYTYDTSILTRTLSPFTTPYEGIYRGERVHNMFFQ